MPETFVALPGTDLLAPARHTAFYDRYQTQYARSLAWLQAELRARAVQRDGERSHDKAWLAERRQLLAQLTGFAQSYSAATQVEIEALGDGASSYQISTANGLRYYGMMWEAATAKTQGMVIIGSDKSGDISGEMAAQIAHYRAGGLRVIMPALAASRHSYAETAGRKWYYFEDDELLHLLFFVVGGSLAGLEAAELIVTSQALAQQEGERLPVALHLQGRHMLTAAIAAALAESVAGVSPFDLLVVGQEAAFFDHQETDRRVNTLWGFHNHFDGLTLLQLAQRTKLLFVESLPTPSAFYSRAQIWFHPPQPDAGKPEITGNPPQPIARLVAPSTGEIAGVIATLLSSQAPGADQSASPPATPFPNAAWNAAYRAALDSKVEYLEKLHVEAQQQRQQRYDPATLTPEAYRARVAAGLEKVAGPPLPETTSRSPRTRRIRQLPACDLYEVILASVPIVEGGREGRSEGNSDVEVAGYLFIPANPAPAPAVICQHGLGGRPDALAGFEERFEGQWVYDQFARRLAERGYVVFVPFMNWGWPAVTMRDGLVKHAYALGMAPNRFEVAQLHAIVDFLQARPEVQAERIAFYGLSYGGHASLWLCAHEGRLAAVVTAGHFNDWQAKLTSTEISPPQERPTSYLTVDEGYDMFNFNVLNELGHAELATRFAPRPYFVENGLYDSVTPTAWVNREFARVQAVFNWLGAAHNAELEHFYGPHRIWAEGSFQFLERHLYKREEGMSSDGHSD